MFRVLALLFVGSSVAQDTMHFLAIGDWGGSSDSNPTTEDEIDNAAGMAQVASGFGGVRFVLAEGDNFYSSGLHGDDHCSRFAAGFEEVFPQAELQVPFYAIAGNHDHGGNVTAQVAYTQDSTRWKYPDFWYDITESFETSDGKLITTQIVQIDTVTIAGMSDENPDNTGIFHPHAMEALADQQMQWLEATLAASTADYLWIGGHYPVYSQCEHGPTSKVISDVLPLMKQYHVNGFIAGHDHCLGHYSQDGMAFVVSGAGKTCCYKPKNLNNKNNAGKLEFRMDNEQTNGARAGFASFSVSANETTIRYHDQDGNVLFTSDAVLPRNKTPTPVPTPPAPTPAPTPTGWECHEDMKASVGTDTNLKHINDDRSTCTDACEATADCTAIYWHKTDNHCHVLTGSFGHDDWEAKLSDDSDYDACFKAVDLVV